MKNRPPHGMETTAPDPLWRHSLFHSADLDHAREQVARIFCPHRLDVIGTGQTDARHHHVQGDQLSLNFIQYGAKTIISPGTLDTFYLLQIPLVGGAAVRNGGDLCYSDSETAVVLNPHRETTMIWEEGTRQVLVQIDRNALQNHLSGLVGGSAAQQVTFSGGVDLSTGVGMHLKNLIIYMIWEIDAGRSQFGKHGLMSRQLENTIMSGLLEAARHNFTLSLGQNSGDATPKHLRLAEAYIDTHLDQPLTLEDIASAAHTTPRTLQNAFRKFRGTTPLRHLRDVRLTRANQELLSAGRGVSVTEVATRWGFSHFSRFSQIYKARFGETPNTTLRSSRESNWND